MLKIRFMVPSLQDRCLNLPPLLLLHRLFYLFQKPFYSSQELGFYLQLCPGSIDLSSGKQSPDSCPASLPETKKKNSKLAHGIILLYNSLVPSPQKSPLLTPPYRPSLLLPYTLSCSNREETEIKSRQYLLNHLLSSTG